ncbi:MAG: DUF1738 domain-containing protein [Chlorobium sp.]|nr:DUF1738 domain-containing protein [Chlorobium sp.]
MAMDVYSIVNDKIIGLLETGTVPWHKPWNAAANIPRNFVTKRPYRGVNTFLLGCSSFSSPYWLTFKQALDKGGSVRKGEKSSLVIFWKFLDSNKSNDTSSETSIGGKIPMLRYFNVFNFEQCDGLIAPVEDETYNDFDPITEAEAIIAGMPLCPEIKYGGNRACYSPMLDYIKMPNRHTFDTIEEFYSTTFHELTHSTGHSDRVGRKSVQEPSFFGSHEYSKEELVAEMGAAFLCGHAGIVNTTLDNSAAYINGWLSKLKHDKTLLVSAAAQAQRAADYILNVKFDNEAEA